MAKQQVRAQANDSLKNWLVAERNNEFKIFSRDQWAEADHDEWTVVVDHLTEEDAARELVRRAPTGNTAP